MNKTANAGYYPRAGILGKPFLTTTQSLVDAAGINVKGNF